MPLAPEIAALLELLRDAPPELVGGPDMPIEEARALHEAGAALSTPPRTAASWPRSRNGPCPAPPARWTLASTGRSEPSRDPCPLCCGCTAEAGRPEASAPGRRPPAPCANSPGSSWCPSTTASPRSCLAAGLDDCTAALRWVHENIAGLGGDAARIGVGGDSAGGNLAAVLAQGTQAHGVPLAAQFLVYPATDLRLDTDAYPSRERCAAGYMFETAELRRAVHRYLGPGTDPADPRVSPIAAADLASAPPALVVTVEFDPLRDEGTAYAAKLAAAGVPVVHQDVAGLVHGTFDLLGMSETARAAMAEAAHTLADLFATVGHSRPAAAQSSATCHERSTFA